MPVTDSWMSANPRHLSSPGGVPGPVPARTGGRGVTLGAALRCQKGGAPCFFALVMKKNMGALLLEYHVLSPKPTTNFQEEMLMMAPLVALGPRWPPRWPHRGWLLLPPSEISSEVKAALERSSCLHIMFARSLSGKPGQDVSPQLTCLTR